MRSNDYWADRANARMDEYMDKAVATTAELELAYIAISTYLAEHARRVFTNFSIGISETDARRLLNTIDSNNTTEWVKRLFNQTKDPQLRQELVKQLESPAYRARLLRLANLSKQVESLTHLAGEKEQALAKYSYLNTATHAYYRTAFDITQGVGNMIEFAATDRIAEIVATNWSGKHYSNRIWHNADMLANRLNSELVVGFATGKSSGKMTRVIADEFNTAFVNAARLLRTETNFVANQAEIESYKALGVKQYKFLATLDSRTSKLCRQQDGKVYSVDKAVAGTNLPPMHANCRSTTVFVLDTVGKIGTRFAKDKRGKPIRVSSDMTYAQWYEKYWDRLQSKRDSGIMSIQGGDKVSVDVAIDSFTPCLIENSTGKIVQTKFNKISANDLLIVEKQTWKFDWNDESLNSSEIYKLTLLNDDEIQGLVAITDFTRDRAVYVNIAESAPHNFRTNKLYDGVGGHLFAIAACVSMEKGYGGYIFMDAKNIELVEHYRDKLGATLLGMPHPYRMFVDEESAQELLKRYTLNKE